MNNHITADTLADIIVGFGYKIKTKTGKSLTILVTGSRYERIDELTKGLSHLGAEYDSKMSGSSIGGIKVGSLRLLIKSDGKSAGLDVEAKAINDLQSAITAAQVASGGPITVRVGKRTIKDVVGVEKTNGTPKSDFHLVNSSGKAVCFISHKKGSKPNDFQQWGGMTEKEIASHKEVIAFAAEAKAKFGDKMPPGTSVYKKITDKKLKGMSVFGVNYGGQPGINNVDVLLQGDPGVKEVSPSQFVLTANHVHYNGDIPDGGFEPVMSLIYKGDRTNLGVKGGRASIYPIAGRKMIDIKDYKRK